MGVIPRILRRPASRLAIVAALVIGVLPFAALADHHEATRTDASFTSTLVEVIEPGEEWVDDAGIFHLRGETHAEEVSGDIAGAAVVGVNVDFLAAGECTEESCPGYTEVWGTIHVTGETGWWEGRFTQSFSDVPGDEYAFTSIAMHGHGDAAGQSFIGQFVESDESSVAVEGTISTMATPISNLNLNVTVCAADGPWTGGYLSTGAIDGSGQAEGLFTGSGTQWTHTYNLTGAIVLTNEHGTVELGFVAGAQDTASSTESASHAFGQFVITGGTGAYAELFGHGRVVGSATGLAQCASGFGAQISLIGEATYN